jgi:hypothetical protein
MKYTSAQANKLLRKRQEERDVLLYQENISRTFVAATTEDKERARPEYSYRDTQDRLKKLEADIRAIKHAISVFNTTHFVDGFDMTVDQLLVYLPQLNERKNRLGKMASALPKQRMSNNGRSNLIEYEYANYEIEAAKKDYEAASDELAMAQVALDQLNNTEIMEINVE